LQRCMPFIIFLMATNTFRLEKSRVLLDGATCTVSVTGAEFVCGRMLSKGIMH